MITASEIEEKCEEFEKKEGRAIFYDLAKKIKDNYPLQAAVIILATWNIGRFRFVMEKENLDKLEKALNECKGTFEKLKDKDFKTCNFDEVKEEIEKVYSILSKIEGVEYTGASKVFHLFCPNLIVMWDSYIRNEYKKKRYEEEYGIRIRNTTPEDFFKFQKLMQKIFGNINWDKKEKTLPKAIDEYNFVKFTLLKLKEKKRKSSNASKSS